MTRRALLAIGLAGVSAPAQTESSAQRGKRVVEEALAAVGGKDFLGMEDRVEAGRAYSFYREELKGFSKARIYTRYLTRPEPPVPGFIGQRERQVFGSKDDSAVLFNEEGGFEVTFRGARPIPDVQLERYRDSLLHSIFYILRQRLGEPGLTFLSQGADIFENQPIEKVEIGDASNRVVTVFFHRSTKLPVRQFFQRRNAVTREKDDEVTLFNKYRTVDGVTWPFQILRERNGEKIFEIFSETVEINRGLKDDLFMLPAKLKVLKKQA